MKSPLVSICLPCLNARPFLEERIESIRAQTVGDWELVVCDSFSDDGSWEILQKFKDDERVRLHQVPRAGMYAGWNECLRRARGEFVYLAAADDTATPRLLESLLGPFRKLTEINVAVCDYQTIDEKSRELDMSLENSPRLFLGEWMNKPCIRPRLTEFVLHCCFNTIWVTMTAVLFRRALLDKVGLFRSDRGSQADLEWTLRATLTGDVAFVPGRLATWRLHGKQATPQRNYDWRFIRTTQVCFDSVLRDPNAGLPEEWRKIRNWDEELTKIWQLEYLDSFHLDRGAARENPASFLANCWAALWNQPGLLASQLARGFAWRKEFSPDRIARADELIRLFGVQWPPRPAQW